MMSKQSPAGFLARLSSPSALSWPVWLFGFAPSMTTAVLHDRNLYGGGVLPWFVAASVGVVAAGAMLGTAALILGSRRPVAVLLVVFALAGATRGMAVGASAFALGVAPTPQLEIRAVSGAVLGLFGLAVATVVVDGFRRHRSAREALDQEERLAEARLGRAREQLANAQARTQSDVLDRVAALAADLSNVSPTSGSLRGLAANLRELSTIVVRPISHDAYRYPVDSQPPKPERRRAYRAVMIDAVTVDPFRPGWLIVLLLPSILTTAVRAYGIALGLLGAVLIVSSAAGVLAIARKTVTPTMYRHNVGTRAMSTAIVWFAAALASTIPIVVSSQMGIGPDYAWSVFGIPLLAYVPTTCVGIAIGSAISTVWQNEQDAQDSRIATLTWLTRTNLNEVQARNRLFAQYLHGSVQSHLTSTALFIDMQLDAGTSPTDIAAVAHQQLRFMPTVSPRDDEPALPVELLLEQVTSTWSRVATVGATVSADAQRELSERPATATAVVEIVREAVANGVRHGNATHITITVAVNHDREIEVTISDNGEPAISATTAAGLGSTMLDDVCLRWSRNGSSTGTTLTGVIALR